MARMNNLLDKYGVRPVPPPPVEPPEPDISPVEPPGPDIPPVEPPNQRGAFRIKSGPADPQPKPTGRTGFFRPKTAEPQPDVPFRTGTGERRSEEQGSGEAGPMPGTFGQSRGAGSAPEDRGAGFRATPAGLRIPQSVHGLAEQLPPLWGVDLALILISLAGIIAVLTHLPALLLALARLVCSAISFLFNIALLLVLGVVVVLWLRRPPRSRW